MSNNGWPNDPTAMVEVGVPGSADTGAVRTGEVAVVLQAFVLDFHRTVEPLTTINGYRSRALNAASGGIETSNHRSATALDLNGYKHPYEPSAPRPYNDGFTAAQTAQVRALLAKYKVIKWGMDFARGFRDAMHFEIAGGPGAVSLVSNQIKNGGTVPTVPTVPNIPPIIPLPPEEDDMHDWIANYPGTSTMFVVSHDLTSKRHLHSDEERIILRDTGKAIEVSHDAFTGDTMDKAVWDPCHDVWSGAAVVKKG